MKACPICEDIEPEVFFTFPGVPVFCNVFWPTAAAARSCPRSDIRLAYCTGCGMIYNQSFDPTLVDYGPAYENGLYHSSRFREYAESSAQRLIDRFDLHGKTIVDIGCGDGYFLERVCERGPNRGVGYDPSMKDRSSSHESASPIMIIPELFTAEHARQPADMICCRHVLEHIAEPLGWLRTIRNGIGERKTSVFFEVPNGVWIVRDLNIWDVIYEHCSYFTPVSLPELFRRAGFEPMDINEQYGHQYLTIDATLADGVDPNVNGHGVDGDRMREHVSRFAEGARARIDDWRARLSGMAGREVVVWGAGSKGVTFLNAVDADGEIVHRIVDLNPLKQGRFVPGSGQLVISPDELTDRPPDIVIVTNPIYLGEIRATLRALDLQPEIMSV